MDTNTKIYITNLGKYNEGYLVGEWISLPFTEEEINNLFVRIKLGTINESGEFENGFYENGSFYEEWAIHDFETEIEDFEIHEYDNIDELNELIEEIENLKDYEFEEVQALIEATGYALKDCIETQKSGGFTYYSGVDSLSDLAEMFVDEGFFGDPKQMGNLVNYIDYESLGRDLGFDGYTVTSNGVIIVD